VLALAGSALDADTSRLVEEMIVGSLDATGRFKVTSRNDMMSLLGFEKQKQSMGCEEASCLAEIAGALGVDLVAAPRAGRLDNLTMLTVAIVEVKTAAALARSRRTVASAAELPAAVDAMVEEMVRAMDGAAPGSPPRPPSRFGQEQERPNREGGDRGLDSDASRQGAAPPSPFAERGTSAAKGEGGRGGEPPPEGRRFGTKIWIATGVAVAAAGAALYFGSAALSETKTRDSTLRTAEYVRASAAADDNVLRANVAWGVTGAAAIAAGVFIAFPF